MTEHIVPTGGTPSLASDLSDKSTPSFGTDDSETDARRVTQSLYLRIPALVAAKSSKDASATDLKPSSNPCDEFDEPAEVALKELDAIFEPTFLGPVEAKSAEKKSDLKSPSGPVHFDISKGDETPRTAEKRKANDPSPSSTSKVPCLPVVPMHDEGQPTPDAPANVPKVEVFGAG